MLTKNVQVSPLFHAAVSRNREAPMSARQQEKWYYTFRKSRMSADLQAAASLSLLVECPGATDICQSLNKKQELGLGRLTYEHESLCLQHTSHPSQPSVQFLSVSLTSSRADKNMLA